MTQAAHRAMKILYFDQQRCEEPQVGFGRGEAGVVRLGFEGFFESPTSVLISGNSYHALLGHGVVRELSRLPTQFGRIGEGRDAVLRPSALESAARVLYEADRRTYGRRFEFVVGAATSPEPNEYRIVVDNREYQRTLARLQFLMTQSGRNGHTVRLRL